MTDPAATLAGRLPADPDDHGPVAVPTDAVRAVLGELHALRRSKAPELYELELYELDGVTYTIPANPGPRSGPTGSNE